MSILLEALILLVIFILYWCNRERRKYLKQRIGPKALLNIYQIGRNLSFMLIKKDLHTKGDTRLLQNGCILYSFHFGVWELMPYTLKKLGYNLGIIVNKYSENKKSYLVNLCDRFLYNFRSRGGIRIFYKEDTIKIVNFIKSGGLFGVLVDGNTFYSKFDKIKKLGRLCDVPVIPFAAYRKKGAGILDVGCNIDDLVRRRPLDYFWFYKSRKI